MREESIFDKYDLLDVDEKFPIPELPESGLILVVGTSGSGKSTILSNWFNTAPRVIKDGSIIDQFSSHEQGERLLIASGLRTIPAWRRSASELSNGERHRFEIALALDCGDEFIDEFSSVVDRDTAKSLSFSIQRHFKDSKMLRLVIATCHRDVEEWLDPDYVYDTDQQQWKESSLFPRGLLRRPKIKVNIRAVEAKDFWPVFKKYHYLSGKLNASAQAFCAFMGEKPIAFCAILRFPNGNFKNAWREHRTVVLAEFQGLGLGKAISETIGDLILESGGRFFSKTSHPAFVHFRNKSDKWKATTKNGKSRADYLITKTKTKEDGHKDNHSHRLCGSHEYIGKLTQC